MTLFYTLELLGTAIFAASGAYTGTQKGMDIVGVLFLAVIVGNGGGTLRDLLLQDGSVYWITQHEYLWISFAAALLGLIYFRFFETPYRLFLVADALGLGVFTVVGAGKALQTGHGALIAIMMGMLTCTGGSILRDLICNEVPLLLRKEIYATAALVGAIVFIISKNYLPINLAIVSAVVLTFIFRVAAIYFNWQIPAFTEHWFFETRAHLKKSKGEQP